MLTFNLKTTFFTVKTSNEVYCCRIYFVNYIQNVHIINRTLHGSLEDMDFMFSWQEQYLTRSLRSLVRYCSCHSNIKSISSRNRVISYIYCLLNRSENAKLWRIRCGFVSTAQAQTKMDVIFQHRWLHLHFSSYRLGLLNTI